MGGCWHRRGIVQFVTAALLLSSGVIVAAEGAGAGPVRDDSASGERAGSTASIPSGLRPARARKHISALSSSTTRRLSVLSGTAQEAYAEEVLADVPVAYWRLDEASGSQAVDASGNGKDGTYVGDPTLGEQGVITDGLAPNLDGVNDGALVPPALTVSGANPLTIEAWVQTTDSDGPVIAHRNNTEERAILSLHIGYTGCGTSQNAGTGKPAIFIRDVGDFTDCRYIMIGSVAVNDGLAHHIVATRNSSKQWKLYVDGVETGSMTDAASNGAPFDLSAIGIERKWAQRGYSSPARRYLAGKVDEVAIYDSALSLDRVLVHYQAGLGSASPSGPAPDQSFGVNNGRCASLACVANGMVAEPVNTLTGAFVHAETDLALASSGVPFEWTRTYTSADTASGRFGPGWTDTYQASLDVQPSGDVVAKGDEGQRLVFTPFGGGFEGAPGARATLETIAGGYRLTTNDQLVYEFDSAGKLLSKKDRNGQGVTLAYDANGRLQTVTDSAGHVATVSYNASDLVSGVSLSDGRSVSYGYSGGRLTSFTDVRGKQWTYTYDAGGRLASIVDPLGHAQVTNVYDQTSGRVIEQTNATNDTTQFAWDEATETATVTDPRGHVWKDVYVDGVLSKRIDGTNKTTEFGFDGDLNESSVKSPLGETTSMTYDSNGNLLTATAPASLNSAQKTFVYNGRNDPTTVTDAHGTVTSYTYTAAGNVETVTQGGQQQAAYTYDGQGRVLTAADANSNTTSYTYDGAGNVASVTQPDPDGPGPLGPPKTTFTYDSQGNVLTRVDPKGNVAGCGCAGQYTTTFTYNPAGQQLTETDPLGHTTTNAYDDAGRLTSTTDANGHTTSYTYDDANRLLTETGPDPDGAGPLTAPVTTYTYDDSGNKLTETDPRGNTTTFGYDDANRLISTTAPDPDGAGPLTAPMTTYTYDANGNLASTVEPRGNLSGANPDDYRTSFTYDAAGRLLTTTDPLGNVTTSVYDAVGNRQSITDANGHATGYTYDYAGRVLTVTAPDPDGAGPLTAPVTTHTYDAAGNRLTRTDANGHVTSWAYDALNRPVSETSPDPDGAGSQTSSLTTTAYDQNGNLLSTTDPNGNGTPTSGDGTTTYGYDRADRLTAVDYSDATPDVAFTLDDVGNRLSMTDGAGSETRTYDNLDRLLSVSRGSSAFSYLYDPAGNVTRRTYPDNTVTDYTYDPLNRMASAATGTLATNYVYDAASNMVERTTGGHEVESRTYDRAGRLVDQSTAWSATTIAHFQITRDPVGNPTQIVRTGALTETQTYGYDNMDRLTSVCFQASCPGGSDPFIRWSYDGVGNRLSEQRPTGTTAYTYDQMDRMLTAGSGSYGYDRNGNQTQAPFRTQVYDLADRLVSWTHGNATMTYLYDGDGKRLRTTATGGNPGVTHFLWDPNNPLPELAVEQNDAGQLVRRYLYGQGLVALTTPSATSLYVQDPLGSTANLISVSGSVQKTYSYEPFGTTRTETGSLNQPIQFTGQYHDPTDLYHLRARQYDTGIGRFLSRDPTSQTQCGTDLSAYAYASNQPTVMVDPSGTTFEPYSDAAISTSIAVTSEGLEEIRTLSQSTLLPCTRSFYSKNAIDAPIEMFQLEMRVVDQSTSAVRYFYEFRYKKAFRLDAKRTWAKAFGTDPSGRRRQLAYNDSLNRRLRRTSQIKPWYAHFRFWAKRGTTLTITAETEFTTPIPFGPTKEWVGERNILKCRVPR